MGTVKRRVSEYQLVVVRSRPESVPRKTTGPYVVGPPSRHCRVKSRNTRSSSPVSAQRNRRRRGRLPLFRNNGLLGVGGWVGGGTQKPGYKAAQLTTTKSRLPLLENGLDDGGPLRTPPQSNLAKSSGLADSAKSAGTIGTGRRSLLPQ